MTADWQETAFETRAIHAGQEPDPTTGAITTPIYQTSTFVQKGIDDLGAYEYGRTHNPTRTALQDVVASLEEAAWGLAYASGLAGTQNISYLLAPGDHIILTDDAYGGVLGNEVSNDSGGGGTAPVTQAQAADNCSLPFTGFEAAFVVLAGIGLVTLGFALRCGVRRPTA